jgi:large subunit ribosomal protein L31e
MIREFAQRHMKSEEVKIDQSLNEVMWERGIRHPPRKIRVKMVKDEDDVVTVSLYSEEVKEEEVEEVKEKPKVEVAVPASTAEVVTEELEKKEEIVLPEPEKVEEVIEEEEVKEEEVKPKKIAEEVREEKKEVKPKKKEKKPELEPETIELSEEELAEMMAGAEGLEIKEEPEKRKDKGKGKKSEEESEE